MVYPHRTNPPRRTLNAIAPHQLEFDPAGETAEARTTRHLRLCQELIERGMRLARIAADRAEQDMASFSPTPMPGSSAAALEQAEARARLRTNYAVIFARLSRAVRQTVALQAHIASGRPFVRTLQPSPAADRPPAPSHAAARPSDRREPRLDAADPPDWLPNAGPNGEIPIEAVLQTIGNGFGADLPDVETPARRSSDKPAGHATPADPPGHRPAPASRSSPEQTATSRSGRRW